MGAVPQSCRELTKHVTAIVSLIMAVLLIG